jgi:ATP-dependent DNA helicase Rep
MSVLNPPQREAIRYLDGPLLVLAGAGSGKTRVITEKIAYLIESCGFSPSNIAAITFTNKAAKEMQERVASCSPTSLRGPDHLDLPRARRAHPARGSAQGARLQAELLDPRFDRLLRHRFRAGRQRRQGHHPQAAVADLELEEYALVSPDQARKDAQNESELLAANAFASYSATLQAYQAVDFDDLIALPVALFENHPEVRDKWQNRLRYLLIDEYQDTNASQYQLLKLLAGPRAAFTAVGDDDQAIYGWRGADIENLRGLPRDYPNLKLIKLEQNYRSTVRILKAANALIAHNEKLFDKKLWSDLGHGDPITVNVCQDNEKEAESVVMKLQAHRFEHRGKFRDYAILYRGNFQARALEQFLRNQRIPYLLSGGQSFFDKAEIKDITAYLRLLANDDDDPAFIRAVSTPRRGVGTSTLQALGGYAGERRMSLFAAAFEEGLRAARAATPAGAAARVLRIHQSPAGARWQRTGRRR